MYGDSRMNFTQKLLLTQFQFRFRQFLFHYIRSIIFCPHMFAAKLQWISIFTVVSIILESVSKDVQLEATILIEKNSEYASHEPKSNFSEVLQAWFDSSNYGSHSSGS